MQNLRKVKFKTEDGKMEGYEYGYFHQFILIGDFCSAIVELPNGNIITPNTYRIKFADREETQQKPKPKLSELKVGDEIEAIDICRMDDGHSALIIGKKYPILNLLAKDFIIKSEECKQHFFDYYDIENFFNVENDLK